MLKTTLTFKKITLEDVPLVKKWLHKEHVAQWFHGDGLKNTLTGIEKFTSNEVTQGTYWLAFTDTKPFAFLITSEVLANEPNNHLSKWIEPDKKMLTLDLLIGEEDYLGKGMAVPLIQQFMAIKFNDIDIVFIDPESSNKKAIHVYEKAGFKKIDSFIASWHPVAHTLMCLEREKTDV